MWNHRFRMMQVDRLSTSEEDRPLWSAAACRRLQGGAKAPHSMSRPERQPVRVRLWQACFEDRRLCLHVVVWNTKELHGHPTGVEDRERRLRISIARLTDRAWIDQVSLRSIESQGRFAAYERAADALLRIDPENYRQMCVAVQDDRRIVRCQDLRRVELGEHVLVFVVGRAVAE